MYEFRSQKAKLSKRINGDLFFRISLEKYPILGFRNDKIRLSILNVNQKVYFMNF